MALPDSIWIPLRDRSAQAETVIERCLDLARYSEEEGGRLTRTYLSPAIREVHRVLTRFMEALGMQVGVDAAGNLRGLYPGESSDGPRLLMGSHLDTVPDAGAFDGALGVILGLALIEASRPKRFRFAIEVVGFSEEEGVRFGLPFLGSRALAGAFPVEWLQRTDRNGVTIEAAIRSFGLDPARIQDAAIDRQNVIGYVEFHIEQGPVLDSSGLPLAVVESIAGQTRLAVEFRGQANHAGTTPMRLRRDALTGAADWILEVERIARATPGLVSTVGRIQARPGAANVIPGVVQARLDVRHARDEVRKSAVESLLKTAQQIARRRGLVFQWSELLDQAAAPCHRSMTERLERAMLSAGYPQQRLVSGAGHDAMILAQVVPAAMLFLRSPGGISHHPSESVLPSDVEAALQTGLRFLGELHASL